MMTSRSLLVASTLLALSAPSAAIAATTGINDPAGDGSQGRKLDVTSATLDNKRKSVKIRVEVEKVAAGHVLAYIKLKGSGKFVAASEYDPTEGTLTNTLYSGRLQKIDCPRFTAAWSTSENVVSLRVPATCLDDGDYDEVRFKLLTERASGGDNDFAPSGPGDEDFDNEKWSWSAYAARG